LPKAMLYVRKSWPHRIRFTLPHDDLNPIEPNVILNSDEVKEVMEGRCKTDPHLKSMSKTRTMSTLTPTLTQKTDGNKRTSANMQVCMLS